MAMEVLPTTVRTMKIRSAIFLTSVDWQAFASCYPMFPCLRYVSGIVTPQPDPILLQRLVLVTDPILWIRLGRQHQIHPEISGSMCMWRNFQASFCHNVNVILSRHHQWCQKVSTIFNEEKETCVIGTMKTVVQVSPTWKMRLFLPSSHCNYVIRWS